MTKVKPSHGTPKDGIRYPKNGSVQKKKHHQKFKKTPTGKVALINGGPQKSQSKTAKHHQNGVSNNSLNAKKSPKGQRTPKSPQNGKKSPASKVKIEPEDEEDDDDSSSDINEGISIKEEVSAPEDDVDDSDSSSEDDDDDQTPDIFGTSLADETDEDDDEFAESDDAEEEPEENKGIKMFKGLKPKIESEESSDDDEEDAEEDDDDEEDDEEEDKKPSLGIIALLGDSIADDSDDEDFKGEDDEEDDEEDAEESAEEVDQSLNTSATSEDDDDDEEDDEEDAEEDDEDSSADLGTSALLGTSIGEDSDDEDFDAEDDEEDDEEDEISEDEDEEDVSTPAKRPRRAKVEEEDAEEDDDDDEEDDEEDDEDDRINNESFDSTNIKSEDVDDDDDEEPKKTWLTKEQKAERDARTIFIGNVPKDTQATRIKSLFKKFGKIESVRIRGVIPENPKIPLKVAAIKRKFHPKSSTICCFVTYKNADSVEQALTMNGKKLDGNYLRVDHANQRRPTDKKRTVFLGNLPFAVEDNEIWEAFKDCGRIESVRIIRDRKTGVGRGFGYINFETEDGAVLAMDMNGTTIKDRELRVSVNTPEGKKKQRAEKSKKRQNAEAAKTPSPKKLKTEVSESVQVAKRNSVNAERRTEKKKRRSQGEKQRVKSEPSSPESRNAGKFQGQKADSKKKSKPDKSAKRKKQMAAKLLARPKKPASN